MSEVILKHNDLVFGEAVRECIFLPDKVATCKHFDVEHVEVAFIRMDPS